MAIPFMVKSAAPPPKPATGGHYVNMGKGQFQLIHATGPGKWAPGPPKAPAQAATNPLLNPSQVLSGPSLQQAAQALTDAQTKGPIDQLTAQLAANQRQTAAAQQKTAGYFNTLGQQAQSGANQEGQIASDLSGQLKGIGANTQSQLAGFGQQAQQAPGLQSLSASGLDGGALSGLAADIAKRQAGAATDSQTAQNAGAVQGANYRSLAASNLGTFGLRGQERLGQMGATAAAANLPLNQQIATLQSNRGALLATNEGKLRQQEISNAITTAGIQAGLTKAQIAAQVSAQNNLLTNQTRTATNAATNATASANNAATNRQTGLNNAATNRQAAADNAATNATRVAISQAAQGAATGRPATGLQANTIFAGIDRLSGELNYLINNGMDPKSAYHLLQNGGPLKQNGKTIKVYASNRLGASMLNAAYSTRSGGPGLNAGDLAWLKSVGIVNPTRYSRASTTGGAINGAATGALGPLGL